MPLGNGTRRTLRLEQWEPAVRRWISGLLAEAHKPLVYQGDLNVAHKRFLDCYKHDPANCTASGRTEAEMAAMDALLEGCELIDGFRHCHPQERSGTCWHTKKVGADSPREHWKRYDYALVSRSLVEGGAGGNGRGGKLRLADVRHLSDAFEGGQPDHVPVESVFTA